MLHTIDLVRQQNKPFAVILTFTPPGGHETEDAIDAAKQIGASVCPVLIGNCKAFFRAQSEEFCARIRTEWQGSGRNH